MIDALASLIDACIKILKYFQNCWRLKIWLHMGIESGRTFRKTQNLFISIENQGYCLKLGNSWLIGNGVIFNMPPRAENTPSWHHTINYHRFSDIRMQFTSGKPLLKNIFYSTLHMFSIHWKINDFTKGPGFNPLRHFIKNILSN